MMNRREGVLIRMAYKSNIRLVIPTMPTYCTMINRIYHQSSKRRTRALDNITDNKVGATKDCDILAMLPNEV